ncbi:DNRLRE domain-containing protein [Paenibacillus sp. PL2-23]|uniref:CBM96 family carbohydrate-binding protein n=1 Tax=Paenibacillus sp. PL2-23 TaxID=2100729 RepID=UPI0030F94C8A
MINRSTKRRVKKAICQLLLVALILQTGWMLPEASDTASASEMINETEGPVRLGLHVTQQELEIWRERAKNGPYKTIGDVAPNSPGSWDRIVSSTRQFLVDPAAGRETTSTAAVDESGAVIFAAPNGGQPWQIPSHPHSTRLRDAAFYALVMDDDEVRAEVAAELLTTITHPDMDFSNRTRWSNDPSVNWDLNPGFAIAAVLEKLLYARDYIGREALTEEQNVIFDNWLYHAADLFVDDRTRSFDEAWPERYNNDYSADGCADPWWYSDPKLFDGGIETYHVNLRANNRAIHLFEFAVPAAIYLKDHGYEPSGGNPGRTLEEIIDVSKQAARDVLNTTIYPFGAMADFMRGYQGGEIALSYGTNQVASITWMAEHLARTGDYDLYDFQTTAGACGSQVIEDINERDPNPNLAYDLDEGFKDIRYANRTVMRYYDGTYNRTWNGSPINGTSTGKVGESYTTMLAARYYQDKDLHDTSLRKRNGMASYPSNAVGFHAQPGYTWHGGFASTLFMFGDMGDVWPYPNLPNPYNTKLSGLTISVGELGPAFDATTNTYSAIVDHTATSVLVVPQAEYDKAIVKVNGTSVTGSGLHVELAVGTNKIEVTVASPSGITEQIYTLWLVRAAEDSALGAPGLPVLTSASTNGTSLSDGYVTLSMNKNDGNNGAVYRLYENGRLLDTVLLADESSGIQTAQTIIPGRANGTYTYTCELANQHGSSSCETLTITVTDANPAKPVLNHDNSDGNGDYSIEMVMPEGTNGSEYVLYENGIVVDSKQLISNTPQPQSASTVLWYRANGTYEYYAEVSNKFGTTQSDSIYVTVNQSGVAEVLSSKQSWNRDDIHQLGVHHTDNKLLIEFGLIPLFDNINAVVAYSDSSTTIKGYDNISMIIRLNPGGYMDVRDADTYTSLVPFTYSSNTSYRFRIEADLASQTYDVWVTPVGKSEIQLAEDYGFRTSAPAMDDLGQLVLYSLQGNDEFQVIDHRVTPMPMQALADGYVQSHQSHQESNYGSTDQLRVSQANQAANTSNTYVKFDISELAGDISGAVLKMFGRLEAQSEQSVTAAVHGVIAEDWTESGLTWVNAPAGGDEWSRVDISSSEARWYQWDVAQYVQEAIEAGQETISFQIAAATEGDEAVVFDSREHASGHAPTLSWSRPADKQPPTVPANVEAVDVTISTATLQWQASTDNHSLLGYHVYRDGVKIAFTAEPQFADTGLIVDSQYKYAIAAVDLAGNLSARSDEITVTATGAQPIWHVTDGAQMTDIEGGFELSGANARAGYMAQKLKDETISFTMNADLEGNAWPAVVMRGTTYDTAVWNTGNQGYLVVFKKDVMEIQKFIYNSSTSKTTNAKFEAIDIPGVIISGEDHYVQVGVRNEGEAARLYVYVDGEFIYEWLDEDNPLMEEGYTVFYAMSGQPLRVTDLSFGPLATEKWHVTDGAQMTAVEGGFELSGANARAGYKVKKFKDEFFSFTMNAELAEGAWPGIVMRGQSYDIPLWNRGDQGYLVAFKENEMEVQKFLYDPVKNQTANKKYDTVDTTGKVVSGKDHLIQVGVVNEGDAARLQVYVDGKLLYEWLDEDQPLLDRGYAVFYAMSGDRLAITNFKYGPLELQEPQEPQEPQVPVLPIIVGGEKEKDGLELLGETNSETLGSRKITTVTLDAKKLDALIAAKGTPKSLVLPFKEGADSAVAILKGDILAKTELQETILEVHRGNAVYKLPVKEVGLEKLRSSLGKDIKLEEIEISIEVSTASDSIHQEAAASAQKRGFELLAPPVQFRVEASYGSSKQEISAFSGYVERLIELPEGISADELTTGVVLEPDGSWRHVPTKRTRLDGKAYAVISSKSNSTYAIIGGQRTFEDIEGHPFEAAITDMGARMIVNGVGGARFAPSGQVTRAEFAAIIVRGLGLKLEKQAEAFTDVNASNWYSSVVHTAHQFGMIQGFTDGSFRPNDRITREQALTIMARVLRMEGIQERLKEEHSTLDWNQFVDLDMAGAWALPNIQAAAQAGLLVELWGSQLEPQVWLTRAEAAELIHRLLQRAELI